MFALHSSSYDNIRFNLNFNTARVKCSFKTVPHLLAFHNEVMLVNYVNYPGRCYLHSKSDFRDEYDRCEDEINIHQLGLFLISIALHFGIFTF
jgi:hypothetical protein